MPKKDLPKLAAAIIVLTIVGSVIMLIPNWNGLNGSVEADKIDTLLDVMIVLSTFVFAIVMVMLGYAVWKYRAKPGDESDGEPIHGNTRLEIAWTVIPTVIVCSAPATAGSSSTTSRPASPTASMSTSPPSSSSGASSIPRRASSPTSWSSRWTARPTSR